MQNQLLGEITSPTATYVFELVSEHFFKVLYFDLGRYLIVAGSKSALPNAKTTPARSHPHCAQCWCFL